MTRILLTRILLTRILVLEKQGFTFVWEPATHFRSASQETVDQAFVLCHDCLTLEEVASKVWKRRMSG